MPSSSSLVQVGCPRCAALFELPPERLGRNVACAACGLPMTARPLAIEKQLAERQRLSEGGAGHSLGRLPLTVLVDNVRSLWNVGSIFRTADACGVREMALCGITGCPPNPQIAKTALGAEQSVAWVYHADAREALARLQSQDYAPVALETSSEAIPFDQFAWPARVCLVIGNEVAGIGPATLEACPHHVSIPMLGVKESLNVAVAFGIAAYHVARTLATRQRTAALRIVGALLLAWHFASAPAACAEPLVLPLTLEKVWYTTDKRSAAGGFFNTAGDLTLHEDSLTFAAKKKTVTIPLDTIEVVSLGKIKGDVDTDWVVLRVSGSPPAVVALRDGRKMGYGQRTREIYDAVKRTVKQAAAAQYGVPAGFRAYEALDAQLTFAVPEEWTGYAQSVVVSEGRAPWGVVVFSPAPLKRVERSAAGSLAVQEDAEARAAALAGSTPAFFLERREVGSGMSCKGFSDAAREGLIASAREDPLFHGKEIVDGPRASAITIDGCQGLKIEAEAQGPGGEKARLDLRAAARFDTLFLLGLRAVEPHGETARQPFETALSTLKFAAGR